MPFAHYSICGIGGSGNIYCSPLPSGATDCNDGGDVAFKACPVYPTPSPTPEPTPSDDGCTSCDGVYAAWGKFTPKAQWNPKEWQDGCLALQKNCTGVVIDCPASVSANRAPPCKGNGTSRAAVDATIGTIAGLACMFGAFRLYRRHRALSGGAGAAQHQLQSTDTGAAGLASEYSQL